MKQKKSLRNSGNFFITIIICIVHDEKNLSASVRCLSVSKSFQKTFKSLPFTIKNSSEALRFTPRVLEWKKPKSILYSGTKNVNHISCCGVTTSSLKKNYVLYCIVSYHIGDKDNIYALLIKSNDSTIPL